MLNLKTVIAFPNLDSLWSRDATETFQMTDPVIGPKMFFFQVLLNMATLANFYVVKVKITLFEAIQK